MLSQFPNMSLLPGARIGPYEVTALLGQGGMGEVYRAHDESLRRDVAIKTLPDLVAGDPDRLARFEREAQLLGSLNHPNIASVYGLERSSAGPLIVMELVEGRTLEEILRPAGASAAPLPLGEVWATGRQIADALEAAHERGIIHRDLKPANIRITPDGHAKLLDFGLGKALVADPSRPAATPTESPTLTARATELGTIMGTAAYMPPEQARGKAVDRRADIWAFGVVLYEMLTGTRAFPGAEITDVLAKVIEREPDLTRLPASTSASIRVLLARCLIKDPRQRLRDIGEARVLLERVIAGTDDATPVVEPARPRSAIRRALASPALPWVVVALLLAAFLLNTSGRDVSDARLVNASLNLPPDVEFFAAPRLSRDGSVAVFLAVRAGERQVFVRRIGDARMTGLPNSEASSVLAVSPNGEHVAWITNAGDLMRLSVDGTVSQRLVAGVDFTAGLDWSQDDRIFFGRDGRLWTVPGAGGEPQAITSVDADDTAGLHRLPVVSFDNAFLFYTRTGETAEEAVLEAVDLRTGQQFEVSPDGYQAIAAFPDRIVLARDSALFAAQLQDGRLTESPVRVREDVAFTANLGYAAGLSATGDLLAAGSAVSMGRLVWVTAEGVETPLAGTTREYANPRVSPDGRLVVFASGDGLWTLNLARGALTKVAPTGAGYPAWVDSTRIAFRSGTALATVQANGTGGAVAMADTGINDFPASASPDGGTLAFIRIGRATSGDVYVMPTDGSAPARPFMATRAYEGGGQFSPDGQWMAYTSDEGGRVEVYLAPYPEADRRLSVSSGGGLHPLWSPDGRHLYYRDGQRLMVVDVTPGPDPNLSPPRLVFEQQYRFGPNLSLPHYSLSPDGRRFLFVREEPGARSLDLVTNWLQTLDRR